MTKHDADRPDPMELVAETDFIAGQATGLARALWLIVSEFPLTDDRDRAAACVLGRLAWEQAEATETAIERERAGRRSPAAGGG